MTTFGTANYAVLLLYLAGMLGIGWVCSRRVTDSRSYFLANGQMNHVVVGVSILGTYLSALTMLALPGMSYGKHDWTFVVQLPFLIVTGAVVVNFILPRYRDAGVISVYEFLEKRIHVSARLVGSVSFIIMSIARMSIILYLTALALHTATGLPLVGTIVVMGAIIIVYTWLGGIEAVIYTDAIQVAIFIIGALLTLYFIMQRVPFDTFVAVTAEHRKMRMLIPAFDPTKIVTLWLILETIFQTIRIYGTQQDIAQRFMTTKSTKEANESVWIATLGYIPLGLLFYFIGTALFVFYKVHPTIHLPVKTDQIYPFFIVNNLPPGLAGLVVAAFFAASMSSIDSSMNSASTVYVEDFLRRFGRKQRSEAYYLARARLFTVIWGGLAILLALVFIRTSYAQVLWGKTMGIVTNGMLGLLVLALLPVKINKWAAGAGMVAAYAALFAMMASNINYLLWPVIGNTLCFFVGLFLSPLFEAAEAATTLGARVATLEAKESVSPKDSQ